MHGCAFFFLFFYACVSAYLSRVYFKYTLNSYRIKKMFIYPNAVIQIILLLLKWRISWLRIVLYKSCHHHDPGVFISRSFACWFISFYIFFVFSFVCSVVRSSKSDIYVARLVYELRRLCIYATVFVYSHGNDGLKQSKSHTQHSTPIHAIPSWYQKQNRKNKTKHII